MIKERRLVLPCPSTAIVGSPRLSTEGGDLLLAMDFESEGRKQPACLRFIKQRAFRKRSEIYCTKWHVEGTLLHDLRR